MKKRVRKISDKQLEIAIIKGMGIISQIMRYIKTNYDIDITRQAINQRIRNSERLTAVQLETREDIKDLCESVVLKAVADGDSKLAFSMLCRLAKDRGYSKFPDSFFKEEEESKIIFDIPNVFVESKEPKDE